MRTTFEAARSNESTTEKTVMYMAIELSSAKWKLAFGDGLKPARVVTVPAADYAKMVDAVAKARTHFKLAPDTPVLSCYEAGREGFAVHRMLAKNGVRNIVVNSASIKVDRRARHAKTDRLDAEQLVRQLAAHHANPKAKELREVAVPTQEDEDRRHQTRELHELKKERTMLLNRMRSLLLLHGVRAASLGTDRDLEQLELSLVSSPLEGGPVLTARLLRELKRLALVKEQIAEINAARRDELKAGKTTAMQQVRTLMTLCGIGIESAWTLVLEAFGWRKFANVRHLGSYLGLTPTPYASGKMAREQGISKAGPARLRALLIEISWLWLRYQPNSELTKWFRERFEHSGRSKRVGIVALARKLAIVAWRFLEFGERPRGANVRPDRFAGPSKKTKKVPTTAATLAA